MTLAQRLRAVPPLAWALAFGALLIVPGLGSFGFWDPWELSLADRAREIGNGSLLDATAGGRHRREPPLDLAAAALGIKVLGTNEFAARLGNALFALGALLAVYWAGLGLLLRKRAAMLAALALATMPLFFQQARQLNSDMALVCALALACGGLGRFAWPADGRRRVRDLIIGLGAMGVGLLSGGALLAIGLPCAALAGALLVGWSLVPAAATAKDATVDAPATLQDDIVGVGPDVPQGKDFGTHLIRGARGRLPLLGVCALGIAAIALAFVKGNVAGEYSLFLGGIPRGSTPTELFSHFIAQLGFGLFPWSAVAVFALGRAFGRLGGEDGDGETGPEARRVFVESYLLVWASLGFAFFTLFMWMTGDTRFAALAPFALAVGAFLDEALEAKRREPVLGFLVAVGTVVVARDVFLDPTQLASVHLLATVNWPPLLTLGPTPLILGVIVGAGLYLSLALRGPSAAGTVEGGAENAAVPTRLARLIAIFQPLVMKAARFGVHAAIVVSLLGALAVNHLLVPELSKHFSFKPVFQSFQRYSKPGDLLGRHRVQGHGASFYGADNMQDIPTQEGLITFFRNSQRAFCLVGTTDLAALDAAFQGVRVPYFVIDASSSRFLLLSNQLQSGETDRNPLRSNVWMAPQPPTATPGANGAITHDWHGQKPPWTWPIETSVVFQDAIELVGADFPSSLRRPGKIALKLYFRVNQRPPAGFKVFVHFDTPGHPRLIGDHDPLAGAFPTSFWLPGEYIRDEHEVDVPYMTTQAGEYTVYLGLWPGGNGTRLKITSGPNDGSDRARLGSIQIR